MGFASLSLYAKPKSVNSAGVCCTCAKARKRQKVYSCEMTKPWIVCHSFQCPISWPKMASSSAWVTCE